MDLYNLTAKLTLDDKDYNLKLSEVKKNTEKTSSAASTSFAAIAKKATAVVAVITAVASALYKLLSTTINYGDEVDKNSQKLNMSTEAYQKWSLALEMAGSDASTLQTGMKTLTNLLDEASNGSADAILTFEKLGLSWENLENMSPEEALLAVVEQFQNMDESASKTQLAIDVFGRSGQELLPILNQEQGSLEELWAQMDANNMIMSEDSVDAMAAMSDKIDFFKAKVEALGNQFSEFLMPVFEWLLDLGDDFISWIQSDELKSFWDLVSNILSFAWDVLADSIKTNFEIIGNAIKPVLTYLGDVWEIIKALMEGDYSKVSKAVGNLFIDTANGVINGLNFILGGIEKVINACITWIPGVEGVSLPKVSTIERLQTGLDFVNHDMMPAYLDYGERVLTKSENAEYSTFGTKESVEAIVNGISSAIKNNQKQNDINVVVQVGNEEFKSYVYKAVDRGMSQKGLKNLKKVGSY